MWHSARQWVGDFASDWAVPICMGLAIGVAVWLVWHFTKPECTATAAANGLCNPGIVARYITVEILLQSGGAALAAGALKGGYDRYMMRNMLNQEREKVEQEREARQQAELELAEARKRNEENTARLITLREEALRQTEAAREEAYRQANSDREEARRQAIAEREEARRQANADREETARMFAQILNEMREERREAAEERRQNVATQQALLDTIVRLAQQQNGNGHSENSDA
ncbi:MAG: ATP synthase F0 subunit B [Chloroflexi bacterium]|nr:ATP synthase F0 subunit B [Chloroflexota bacterium]